MSTKSYAKTRLSANDAALVMIDHQSGVMQLVHDCSSTGRRLRWSCSGTGASRPGRTWGGSSTTTITATAS
jgi:hypothetical protein